MLLTAFSRWLKASRPPSGLLTPDLLKNLDRVETFPTLSDTVIRAIALANDPNASLDQMGGLIRRDALTAAAVLKRANSWSFRGRHPVGDVQQAVVRLGMRECNQVVTAVGMRALYAPADEGCRAAAEVLLRHGLLTACLASAVNRALDLGFRGEEFSAGLLHDIGRLVVLVRAPQAFPHAAR
jgi:HD-like signal output (HDOD) protein